MRKYIQAKSFKIGLVFLVLLWVGSSLAQNTLTTTFNYQATAAEIATYGPGFPNYCSASSYSSRPECVRFNDPVPSPGFPSPCDQTGGYQSDCLNDYMPPPLPAPFDPCVTVALCYEDAQRTVYDFRLSTPPPAPNCQYGYSPHCLAIATSKHFEDNYATSPSIPSYYLYLHERQPETLNYRINSPYHGYLYVFVTEPDQTTKLLYPNAYSDAAYVNPGRPIDLPGNNASYELQITEPYGRHKLFSIVLSQPIAKEVFQGIRTEYDLNDILLELGLQQNIHHGYAETAFDVKYVIY